MTKSVTFCPLPFGHTMISTVGDFRVCCRHEAPLEHRCNINQHTYSEWNDSTYLAEVRDSIASGHRHPGCQECWDFEDLGQESPRTRSEKEFQILKISKPSDQTEYPVNIEIDLGNLCNLKCLMCSERSSSAILAENIRLGINESKQTDFKWSVDGFKNLHNLLNQRPKIINIRGGEPFYNKELLKLVEEMPPEVCRSTALHITTNATIWSTRWAKALEKFRLVRIMLSVDAIEDLYEYIRFPASWSQVEANIHNMTKISNIKLLVHCTVQNLNIANLKPLIEWTEKNKLHLSLEQLVNPNFLHITNLPKELRTQAVLSIDQTLTDLPNLSNRIRVFLQNCRDQLNTASDNPILWQAFQKHITLRDGIRNNTYTKFLQC